jgi:hypothetical protein
MAPTPTKPKMNVKDQVEDETRLTFKNAKQWKQEFVDLCLFIDSIGTRTDVDNDGRKTEVFSVEGHNCKGLKYVVQAWGQEAAIFEEWFK